MIVGVVLSSIASSVLMVHSLISSILSVTIGSMLIVVKLSLSTVSMKKLLLNVKVILGPLQLLKQELGQDEVKEVRGALEETLLMDK